MHAWPIRIPLKNFRTHIIKIKGFCMYGVAFFVFKCLICEKSRISDWATDWTIRGSILGRGKRCLQNVHTGLVTQPPTEWVPGTLAWRYSSRSVKLITHLHLVTRLRMYRAIIPLHLQPSWREQRQLYPSTF
jgi:hypothetical protein